MNKELSHIGFRLMAFGYRFRDFLQPRGRVLEEVGIEPGFTVLDYGCGPGGYVEAAGRLVGESGRVHALDMHPLAVESVRNIARRKQLTNVETIHSDCETGLPDDSVDVVLLYDILHMLGEPDRVLQELHRVLKPGGILSLSDHHMKQDDITSRIADTGLFRLVRRGSTTYSFAK